MLTALSLEQSFLEAVIEAGGCMVIPHSAPLTEQGLMHLATDLHPLKIELTADKQLIIMAPIGGESGFFHSEVAFLLKQWAKMDASGLAFDSNTAWQLPGGSLRAPDAAWVLKDRIAVLSPSQKKKFLPLCPDFVAEVKSPSDRLTGALGLLAKMEEWMAAGARLGWLIDPDESQAWVYRPGLPLEHLTGPDLVLLGYDVLPGCAIALADLVRL